ncbi:hypothetical protein ILUMI_25611, partial [Ignelater luminosus]
VNGSYKLYLLLDLPTTTVNCVLSKALPLNNFKPPISTLTKVLLTNLKFFRKNGSAATRDLPRTDPDAHNFQEYTYKKITPCDVCSQILRGHTRQGLKCRFCKMNVHVDCQDKAPKCQPKSGLLRRQKSTSEIESRVPEPTVEEESVEDETFSGMATINRQLSIKNNSLLKPPQENLIDRRRGHIDRVQGPSNTETTSMRRRLFAGMKSLTGFGSRSRHGSPSHRSISLPEKRSSQDASGTRPFGEPLCLIPQIENGNGREMPPTPPSPSPSKGKTKKSVKNKK